MVNSQSLRSPMKSLETQVNIPLTPPKKSIQLGIQAFTKKRLLDHPEDPNPYIKKIKPTDTNEKSPISKESTTICHQCRQPVHKALCLQCTYDKQTHVSKRCPNSYCCHCLINRYGETINTIFENKGTRDGQGCDRGYSWTCPSCLKKCNCTACRKNNGPQPIIGYVIA